MQKNTKNILVIVTIIILTIISYFNTLNNSFVYDDNTYIVENRQIRSISNIPKTFLTSYPPDSEEQGLYRPLVAISYIIDYALWGLDPKGFHLTNLFLHIIASIIVYFLALKIFKSLWPSIIAALIFALHPVHTEAVAWVVGRAEVMAGLFYFLAFLLYIRAGESMIKNRFFIASIISYLFALLSKETALTLPILLFVYDYYFVLKTPSPQPSPQRGEGVKLSFYHKRRVDERESLLQVESWVIKWLLERYLFFLIITIIYITVRIAVLGAFGPQKNLSFAPDTGLYERFLTIIVLIGYYIRLLFLPFNLTVDYVFPKIVSLSLPVIIYGGMLLASIAAAILLYKKSKKPSFFILIFFITLLPVSNIIPIGELIAERFLYIPLIAFSFLIGSGTDYFLNKFPLKLARGAIAFLLSSLIAYYSLLTINRNYDWRDPEILWKATIHTMPLSSVAHNNLGLEYAKKGEYEFAILEYKKAIEISPSYFHALVNLGDAYLKAGLASEAIESYKMAIKAEPAYSTAYNNLGFAYFEKGMHSEALREYKKAIELNPKDTLFYNNLGNLYASLKRYDDAITEYKNALSIDPEDVNAYNNLGVVYAKQGRFNEAEAEVKKALSIDPENSLAKKNLKDILNRGKVVVEADAVSDKDSQILAYNELGNRYKQKGLYDEAIFYYKRALEIDPKHGGSHYNLGLAYVKKGMYKEAATETETALKLDAKLSDAHRNLGLIYYLYLKDNKKAVYHFKELLRLDSNQPDKKNINKIIKELEDK